jgi:maltose alpha-D-glucosyltransferase/alpha-amylase
MMSSQTASAEPLPVLEIEGGWESLFDGKAKERLEGNVLPRFIRSQRWFGAKARSIERIEIADWGKVEVATSHAYVVFLRLVFETAEDCYFVPLAITSGQEAARFSGELKSWALARLLRGPQEAILHDALADDELCRELLSAIGEESRCATRKGTVRGIATGAFAKLHGNAEGPLPIQRAPATSSNTLVFYDGRLLLKLFRRLEAGINPDFEIGRFLTEQHPFDRVPAMAGSLVYEPANNAEPFTLAILQAVAPNRGDGWRHALHELDHYFQRVGAGSADPSDRATIGDYLQAAGVLGRRTAELHAALADPKGGPAFAPEPMTDADVEAQRNEILSQGRLALTTLGGAMDRLTGDVAQEARQLLNEGDTALARLRDATLTTPSVAKIRVHGDYHLGQVLWTGDDYVLIDFEGEPTRPVAERRARFSGLRDVAGMLRSYHYAAYAGLFAFAERQPSAVARLEAWAELWQREVSAEFLRSYRAAAGSAPFVPRNDRVFSTLLNSYMLSKAFYELVYELNNRPDWVRIPLRGVLALLRRGPSATP